MGATRRGEQNFPQLSVQFIRSGKYRTKLFLKSSGEEVSSTKRQDGVESGTLMETYVQIGAGAGDQDSRANFRDGFTEFVKKRHPNQVSRIILVEPNPFNIEALRRCWKDYPQAEIVQMGVCPQSHLTTNEKQTFYYAEEDAPCFQVFSLKRSHVEKHYPNGTIRAVEIPIISVNKFIERFIGANHVSMLALDIEGIDAEIILDINWENLNVFRVSFEHIHLGENMGNVLRHLARNGYMFIGNGLDTSGFDLMYENMKFTGPHGA